MITYLGGNRKALNRVGTTHKTIQIMYYVKISFCLILMSFFLISCEKTENNQLAPNISEERFQNNENEAIVTLNNGNKVYFKRIDDGELKGTFLLEESNCKGCSALTALTEMTDKEISEEEIFWALSAAGTPVPSFLETQNNKTVAIHGNLQEQGWGRELTKSIVITDEAGVGDLACNNSSFTGSIAGGFLGNPEFVVLDKTPNSYNGFINDCASLSPSACNKGTRYKLHATMSGINKWRGKICSKAVQNGTNDHYISNTTGGLCGNPPCSAYVGPELHFEYYSNGKWKSMKNPLASDPEGFEVPANTTKVYTYSWNTNANTSFRLRVKNAMGKDQFDFMMDREDVVIDDGGGDIPIDATLDDFPETPDYIEISGSGESYLIVDFTNMIDSNPKITIPKYYLKELPHFEGVPIFPNNFCGIEARKPYNFMWFDNGGQVVNQHPYNSMHPDSTMSSQYPLEYMEGIRFAGPIGKCDGSNKAWKFPYPVTSTVTVAEQPLKLVIQLNQDSEIKFFPYGLDPSKYLKHKELFKDVDFNKMIKWFNKTFYYGFKWWFDALCEETPSDCPLEE